MSPSATFTTRLIRLAWLLAAAACFTFGVYSGFRYALRPLYLNWGTSPAEQLGALPGDEYTPNPQRQTTRAITINAPIGQVWPWVVQIGADTAGFYTYTWFEALIACPIQNADRIHPEWQQPKPGDGLALCPDSLMPPPYEIIAVQPGQALILGHRPTPADNMPNVTWFESWSFSLQAIDANTTRLLIRGRSLVDLAWMQAIEPGVFIMEYGMLHGLQARAEGWRFDPSQAMLYRLLFGALLLGALVLALRSRPSFATHSRLARVLFGLLLLALLPLLAYPFDGGRLAFAAIALPAWLRWLGALLAALGLLLWMLAQRALEANPAAPNGPYTWCDCPRWLAQAMLAAGGLLLGANWLLLAFPLALALNYLGRAHFSYPPSPFFKADKA